MLSILIPTYNYNALPLAEEIEKQALALGIVFELICMDDGSFSLQNAENQKINTLANCKFIEGKQNIGRNANRHRLAEMAQYDWLLFVDSDSLPKNDDFIKSYIEVMKKDPDAVFGGFAYSEKLKNPEQSLRYHFGKAREQVPSERRNKNPYKVIISANFLIKKSIFLKINQAEIQNLYGLDYLFAALLKNNANKVLHIDNEVYHMGIDQNQAYLEKTKKAVETLHYISTSRQLKNTDISLLKAFRKLKRFGLNRFFGRMVLRFNNRIERNLLSDNPSMFLFDIYRLGYFCRLRRSTATEI